MKTNNNNKYIGRGIGTLGVCLLGAYCMYLTNGSTGIGWAILGVFIIWVI